MFRVYANGLESEGFVFKGSELKVMAAKGIVTPATLIEADTGAKYRAGDIKDLWKKVEAKPVKTGSVSTYLTPRFARVAWAVYVWLWSAACVLFAGVFIMLGFAEGSAVSIVTSLCLGFGVGTLLLVCGIVAVRMAMEGALILFDIAETLNRIADKE